MFDPVRPYRCTAMGIARFIGVLSLSALVACSSSTGAVGNDDDIDLAGGAVDNPTTNPPIAGSAFEVLQGMPENTLFVEALTKGGVHHQVSGAGDYTFFAPTNAAIEAWAADNNRTVEDLLTDNNLLYRSMKYHIIAGRTLDTEFDFGRPLTSVRGDLFKTENFDAAGIDLRIFDGIGFEVKAVQTNIDSTNGVIHVIDRVMRPTDNTVGSLLEARGDLSIFTKVVQTGGFIDTFKFETDDPNNPRFGGFTVFAPNDTAFAEYLSAQGLTEEQLLNDVPLMQEIVSYHSLRVGQTLYYRDLPSGPGVLTNDGSTLTIDAQTRAITDVAGGVAQIAGRDTMARNGVVHVIDRVLIATP